MSELVPLAPTPPPPDPCDALDAGMFGSAGCAVADGLGQLGSDAVAAAGRSALENLAFHVGQSAAEFFAWMMTFWLRYDGWGQWAITPDSAAVQGMQSYTRPIVVLVLVISVLAQAIRMMVSRKKDPAVDIAVGLVRYALYSSLGLVLLAAALRASDELAAAIIAPAAEKFGERMAGVFTVLLETQPITLIFFGGLILTLAALQVLLLFVRQAGILVLATMIPLAASGSVNRSTRPWMSKLAGWLVVLVAYKPMAAMIYAIGFQLLGEGDNLAAVMTGLMVLVLATVAMPAMLRFFKWSSADGGGGGGVGGVLAAGATGASALNQFSGGGSANQQADAMYRSGPQTAPAGAGPAPAPST
ncbi:MAG: hypothetical protein AB7V44_25570, partial [Pseudonocardia sp.]